MSIKKICINCQFADVAFADKEYDSIAAMVADAENDYLVCTRSLKIKPFKVDENDTCNEWKRQKDNA